MEVPSMLRGESLKRLLQGVVLGVALTVVIGFNWLHYGFGWTLGGTAETMASHRVDVALVAAYTPVCDRPTMQSGKSSQRSRPGAATTLSRKPGLQQSPVPQNPTAVSPSRAPVFSRNC